MQIGVVYPQTELPTDPSVDTMGSGLLGLDAHLDAPAKAGEALQLAGAAEPTASAPYR
jgi:hypothetical protein